MSQSPEPKGAHASKVVDGKNSFAGAAIKGSSLLNTVGDIRPFVQRGSTVLINNVPYEVSLTGEWNSNSVQLSTDYAGETNFSVAILIPDGSFSPKKKKGSATAGASKGMDMKQMVQGLDSITETFGAKLRQQDAASHPAVAKTKRPATKLKAPTSNATESEPYVDTSIRKNLPKKLPPLPASVDQNDNNDNDVNDEDSIDASREKATQKPASLPPKVPTKARLPPKQQPTSGESPRPSSGKEPASMRPQPPKEKHPQKARSKPTKSAPSASQASSSPTPSAASAPAEPSVHVPPANLKTVEEERRAALQRVRLKAKEDQAALEKAAAAKEEELKAIREASENRAKELQARTALRVEQYMAEKQRKIDQQKDLERYEEEQRQLRKQQHLNPSRHIKMKEIRKESQQRLDRLAYEDLVKAQIAEEHVQKSLFERHKKYEANTTFLPRLDGGLAQGSTNSSGVATTGQESNNPPGRVIKSIAAELDRFEMDSATFPEEPSLRSHSAKQPKRRSNAGASRSDSLPAIRGAQNNPNHSAPAARSNYQKPVAPVAVRDEDEWSDDEPDPIQEAAMHAQANRKNNDLDEDSLNDGNQESDDEEDEGAVLERQIFGQAGPTVAAVSHQRVLGQPQPVVYQGSIQQQSKPSKPPVGKKKTPRRTRNNNSELDDDASECSDIAIDSMLGGGAKVQQQKGNKTKAHTPNKTSIRSSNGVVTGLVNTGFPAIAAASAGPSQVMKQAPYQTTQSFVAPVQSAINAGQGPAWSAMPMQQQEVTFAPRAPAPQVYQAPVSVSGSSPSVSPNKPKKNTFKKLKPIPISSAYQPVIKVDN